MASSSPPSSDGPAGGGYDGGSSLFRFDCSRLLEAVANAEAIAKARRQQNDDFSVAVGNSAAAAAAGGSGVGFLGGSSSPSSLSFGHPDPPNVKLHCLDRQGLVLVVAYTPHFVFVQLAGSGASKNNAGNEQGGRRSGDEGGDEPPLEICRLINDDDDYNVVVGDESDDDDGRYYHDGNRGGRHRGSSRKGGDEEEEIVSCVATVLLEDEDAVRFDETETTATADVVDDDAAGSDEEGGGDDGGGAAPSDDVAGGGEGKDGKKKRRKEGCSAAVSMSSSFDVSVDGDDDEGEGDEGKKRNSKHSILRGVLSMTPEGAAEDQRQPMRVSVVIGTTTATTALSRQQQQEKGRVYAVELLVHGRRIVNRTADMYEALPRDDDHDHDHADHHHHHHHHSRHHHSFRPHGGVASMSPYRCQEDSAVYLWIAYRDGTLLRVHSAGFFPSLWRQGGARGLSLDDVLSKPCVVRCRIHAAVATSGAGDHRQHPDEHTQSRGLSGAATSNPGKNNTELAVTPLPRSFPSPLSALPLEPWKVPRTDVDSESSTRDDDDAAMTDVEEEENEVDDGDDTADTDTEDEEEGIVEALVFGGNRAHRSSAGAPVSNPTLACYTSESQLFHRRRRGGKAEGGLLMRALVSSSSFDSQGGAGGDGDSNVLVGATKAIVGGVWNVLKWGVGGGEGRGGGGGAASAEAGTTISLSRSSQQHDVGAEEPVDGEEGDANDRDSNVKSSPSSERKTGKKPHASSSSSLSSSPFPSLWSEPIRLFPGQEIHDAPRQIESCCIDPDEHKLAALTDNLGRVLLLDLSMKQIVRLWKGYRDATCSWLHSKTLPLDCTSSLFRKKPPLHLAIYSRQRRVVDVWRVRPQGPRVASLTVPDRCATLLEHSVGLPSSHLATSFVLSSRVPGSSQSNLIEQLSIDNGGAGEASSSGAATKGFAQQQGITLPDSPQPSIYSTKSVSSFRETALRLQRLRQMLSTTSVSFTAQDVYQALRGIQSLPDLATALDLLAQASVLENKLGVKGSGFHKQVVAYCQDVLDSAVKRAATFGAGASKAAIAANPNVILLTGKIEYHSQLIAAFDVLHKFEMSSYEEEASKSRNPDHWILESVGWASLYEECVDVDLDEDVPSVDIGAKKATFSQFATSCTLPNDPNEAQRLRIYFSQSSRTRKDILNHVFKPLLADVFSFKVVYSIFDSMAIQDDVPYLSKCFGEWIMTLSVKEVCRKGLLAPAHQSPLLRFLQDIAAKQLEKNSLSEGEVVLGVLHSFCTQATDLVRAFMLAVMCREAAETVSSKREKITYGKILASRVVEDWEVLLRKLRVCLLVSIRLHHTTPQLPAPISIHNVNEEGLFSVYEWLAQDELSSSHKHEEILSIEIACKISSLAFNPSTSDGDGPSRFKQMKNACLAAAVEDEERAEYMIARDEDADRFGSLLLFFPSYNEHLLLVAHRAKILAFKWSKSPSNLETLHDAFDALSALHKCSDMSALALALCLDIWQSIMSPIFRANLFGFDDVQEISADIVEPLLQDHAWFATVGKVALNMLEMLKTPWSENGALLLEAFRQVDGDNNAAVWPPVRTDHILKRLLDKARRVDDSALDTHIAVVSALLISKDVEALVRCIPAVYECFSPYSLFSAVGQPPDASQLRSAFIGESILGQARLYDGPVMDKFDMAEVETLSKIWGFDTAEAKTLFLLAMYEVGKDRVVDDLVTKCTGQVNVHRFIEGGVDIACRRLHAFLSGREMQTPGMREAMGALDADLCDWIRNRGRQSRPSTPVVQNFVSIGQTHLFALRLLSLSASSGVDTELRVKIHSMVVLSGTLVKLLEIKSGNASITRGSSIG